LVPPDPLGERSVRQIRRTLGLVAAGLVLAACATATGSAGEPTSSSPGSSVAPSDPLGLIGSWTVTEADEEQGVVLRLAADGLRLFGACGSVNGDWRASTDGLFVGHTFGGGCSRHPDMYGTPAWLRQASGFRQDGDAQVLLDENGETVARLVPGARPTPGPNLAPQEAAPPVVDKAARQSFAPASPLPANLRPAAERDLLGRWVPADGRPRPEAPFAEFAGDHGWRGSDGCNGLYGRWASGPAGTLLATAGPQTLIGCDNAPVASWLAKTYRAGFDGDVLVLFDQVGNELGRLRRDG
jgi:hypothetical protein